MRDVPTTMSAAWKEGLFVGDRRPIARVTVQHPRMCLRSFSLLSTFTETITSNISTGEIDVHIDLKHKQKVHQMYSDFLFTGTDAHLSNFTHALKVLADASGLSHAQMATGAGLNQKIVPLILAGKYDHLASMLALAVYLGGDSSVFTALYNAKYNLEIPKELPNVKSVQWSRSVDTDVADCTITVWNTKPLEIGETPNPEELDEPGYYTYDRGGSSFSAQWGHVRNSWFGMLVPDNIIRTYEGYGHDSTHIPETDPNLVQTGMWMIDSITSNTTGTMTIKCRDIGRILMDQMFYQPVVPQQFYDRGFENWDGTFPVKPGQNKLKVSVEDSSNEPWIGQGSVAGHKIAWAFDGDPNTYWLSIGNDKPSRRFAYEWVQCKVDHQSVNRVKIRTKKKGYTYYISVKVGGVWQGSDLINYHEDGIGMNNGDVHYVTTGVVDSEGLIDIPLPKTYAKVQSMRVTLGNLQDFHIGTYHFRAGLRDVEVYGPSTSPDANYMVGPAGSNPGKYSDYTDIVKLLCAWGGFYWPRGGKERYSDGSYHTQTPDHFDTVLGHGVPGNVWGDFQVSGVTGPTPLPQTDFDKKSLLDCINSIRDTLGFVFFIDESGAVQWRAPNIYNYGCLATGLSHDPGYKPGFYHPISEHSVLLSLDCAIDAKNVREAFFVGDVNGQVGAFAPGFNPNPTGLRRMAGWTDKNFAPVTDTKGHSTKAQVQAAYDQCQLMADMLSLRQLFTYRQDRVRIPANPAIQIDDQVKITERNTEESYVHYISGISSNLDMENGEWTYDMTTQWLGETPSTKWLFKTEDLYPVTRAHIKYITDVQKSTSTVTRLLS